MPWSVVKMKAQHHCENFNAANSVVKSTWPLGGAGGGGGGGGGARLVSGPGGVEGAFRRNVSSVSCWYAL